MMNFRKFEEHLQNELSSLSRDDKAGMGWSEISKELDELEKKKKKRRFILIVLLSIGFLSTLFIGYQNCEFGKKYEIEVDQVSGRKKTDIVSNKNKLIIEECNQTQLQKYEEQIVTKVATSSKTIEESDKIIFEKLKTFSNTPNPINKTILLDSFKNDVELYSLPPIADNFNEVIDYDNSYKKEIYQLRPRVDTIFRPGNQLVDSSLVFSPLNNLSPSLKKSKAYWSIGAEGGSHRHIWQMKSNNASLNDYLTLRNNSETSATGSQKGLRIKRFTKNGWSFGVGFFHKTNWNVLAYRNVEVDSILKENIVVKIIVEEGTNNVIEEIYGDAKVQQTTYRNIVNYNPFNQFQIPISAGYLSDKVNESIYYGMDLDLTANFWLKREGLIFDEFSRPIAIENELNKILNPSRINWSVGVNPIFGYQVNNHFSFYARPSINFSLTNWLSQESEIIARPLDFGLAVGVNYRLNPNQNSF